MPYVQFELLPARRVLQAGILLLLAVTTGCGGQPDPIPRLLRPPSPSPSTAAPRTSTQASVVISVLSPQSSALLSAPEIRHAR